MALCPKHELKSASTNLKCETKIRLVHEIKNYLWQHNQINKNNCAFDINYSFIKKDQK